MNVRSLVIAAGVSVLFACSANAADSLSAKADSGSGVFFAASLAPLNSFEWKAAPVYTRVTVARRNALIEFQKGRITVDQAQAALDSTNKARALLDSAVATCAQNNSTGKCGKNGAAAERLLQQAVAALGK